MFLSIFLIHSHLSSLGGRVFVPFKRLIIYLNGLLEEREKQLSFVGQCQNEARLGTTLRDATTGSRVSCRSASHCGFPSRSEQMAQMLGMLPLGRSRAARLEPALC